MSKALQALFDLSGKTALVTGGAGYLGSAMSEALYEAGAFVIVGSRNYEKCRELCHQLDTSDQRTDAVRLDIASLDSVKESCSTIEEKYGGVDILVNNASSAAGAEVQDMEPHIWQSAFDGNITGYFYCSQVFGKGMIKRRQGVIITVSSILGLRPIDRRIFNDTSEFPPVNYATAKGAVISLTKFLAGEWAHCGIRVNAITPGPFPPEERLTSQRHRAALEARIPLGRVGKPHDLKGAIVFLSSDAASYITGHNLVVDGGWTVW